LRRWYIDKLKKYHQCDDFTMFPRCFQISDAQERRHPNQWMTVPNALLRESYDFAMAFAKSSLQQAASTQSGHGERNND
jgi:hypothetical protein